MKKKAPIEVRVIVMVIIEVRRRIRLPRRSTRSEAAREEKNCIIPRIIVEVSAVRPTPEIWKFF